MASSQKEHRFTSFSRFCLCEVPISNSLSRLQQAFGSSNKDEPHHFYPDLTQGVSVVSSSDPTDGPKKQSIFCSYTCLPPHSIITPVLSLSQKMTPAIIFYLDALILFLQKKWFQGFASQSFECYMTLPVIWHTCLTKHGDSPKCLCYHHST